MRGIVHLGLRQERRTVVDQDVDMAEQLAGLPPPVITTFVTEKLQPRSRWRSSCSASSVRRQPWTDSQRQSTVPSLSLTYCENP